MPMIERICKEKSCKKPFQAKAADVKRGWGLFCSKQCKAKEQERRTHQHANYLNHGGMTSAERDHEVAMSAIEDGWDGHKNAF